MWFGLLAVATGSLLAYCYQDFLSKVATKDIPQFLTFSLSKYLVETHRHYYVVNYPYGMKWYKLIVPRKMNILNVDSIVTEYGENVYDRVLPFMGPGHDFHGVVVTPDMLGFAFLRVNYFDGHSSMFQSQEPIILDYNHS